MKQHNYVICLFRLAMINVTLMLFWDVTITQNVTIYPCTVISTLYLECCQSTKNYKKYNHHIHIETIHNCIN